MNYCRFNKHSDNIQLDQRIVLTCRERFNLQLFVVLRFESVSPALCDLYPYRLFGFKMSLPIVRWQ